MIRGRATTVLICEMDDGANGTITVAVKDTWVIEGRQHDEGYFYAKANGAGVGNIPTLLKAWNVLFEDEVDTTRRIPGWGVDLEVRVHRRFIFREYGESLAYFDSKLEFLYALIDALEGTYSEN